RHVHNRGRALRHRRLQRGAPARAARPRCRRQGRPAAESAQPAGARRRRTPARCRRRRPRPAYVLVLRRGPADVHARVAVAARADPRAAGGDGAHRAPARPRPVRGGARQHPRQHGRGPCLARRRDVPAGRGGHRPRAAASRPAPRARGRRRSLRRRAVAELRADAKRAGLADRLVVTGYVPPGDVAVALEAMDVVVVPYATEDSVSYSLHVALGQGRPVVATALAPLRELEERGRCLALVQPDDAHDLAKTLGGLLDDPAARRRLAEAAGAYAAAQSVFVTARRTAEVYARAREGRR